MVMLYRLQGQGFALLENLHTFGSYFAAKPCIDSHNTFLLQHKFKSFPK
jgi:hypothetical protein